MVGRCAAIAFVAAATTFATACARDPNENNPWRVTKLDGGSRAGDDPTQAAALEAPPARATATTVALPMVMTTVGPVPTVASLGKAAPILRALGSISLARCRAVGSGSTSGSVALSWDAWGRLVMVRVNGFTPAECACAEKVLWGAKLPSMLGRMIGAKVTL